MTMQLAVRARMRLLAGREKVGRDVVFGGDEGDEGDELDRVLDLGKRGEEFRRRIAVRDARGDGIVGLVGIDEVVPGRVF